MANAKKTDTVVIVKKSKNKTESTLPVGTAETKSKEQGGNDVEAIKILFHGSCPKLSTRGVGDLEYEIGIDDTADEVHIRIAGNASSGAYSTKWVNLDDVRSILDNIQDKSFKAIVLKDLYANQSSSNIGYIGAILKAEGVLMSMDSPPSAMKIGSWDNLMKKITRLKNDGITLKDHIAIAIAEKAKKKKIRGAKRKVVEKKPVEKA